MIICVLLKGKLMSYLNTIESSQHNKNTIQWQIQIYYNFRQHTVAELYLGFPSPGQGTKVCLQTYWHPGPRAHAPCYPPVIDRHVYRFSGIDQDTKYSSATEMLKQNCNWIVLEAFYTINQLIIEAIYTKYQT